MKCPYCNKEMECGFVKSSSFMFWGKERELGFLPDDVKLAKTNFAALFKGYVVESDYCNSCKKIIVSVADQEEQ